MLEGNDVVIRSKRVCWRPGLFLSKTGAIASPAFLLVTAVMAAIAVRTGDFYLLEVLVSMVVYAQFAASWDVLSGYTEQDNFGHAFFVGGAGYLAAVLNKSLHLSPYLTVPISALCVAAAGAGIGWLTLRLRGPYFALSTIALSAVLYKLAFIFSRVFGGEEGITGVVPFASDVRTDFFVCLALFVISVSCLCAFARSHYGLILRSTRGSEDAAQSSGINTAYYKIVGCAVSGFFAGIGGAMYAHANMQIGPSMLAGSLSVFVVLLATIGGRGTILGPVYAAAGLTLLNEWLRVVDQYRIVIFTATVITLVYLYPSGLVRARAFVRAPAWFRRFLLGPVD